MTVRWFVLDVNPEPWVVPPMSPMRNRHSSKLFVKAGQDPGLTAYQQSIKEALGEGHTLMEGRIKMTVMFWRSLAGYVNIPRQRTRRNHQADTTNMVKALEDALQGILFSNDRDVVHTEAAIVEQGPKVHGKILLGLEPAEDIPGVLANLPQDVYLKLQESGDPFQPELELSPEDQRYAETPVAF